ncbi:MAG: hypothetical protein AAFS03_11360, partial [Pseudomonadota bacterium]
NAIRCSGVTRAVTTDVLGSLVSSFRRFAISCHPIFLARVDRAGDKRAHDSVMNATPVPPNESFFRKISSK